MNYIIKYFSKLISKFSVLINLSLKSLFHKKKEFKLLYKFSLIVFELQYKDLITLLIASIQWIFTEIIYLIKVIIWLVIDIISRYLSKLNFKIILFFNIRYKRLLTIIIPRIFDQPNVIKLLNISIIKKLVTKIMWRYNKFIKNDISYLTLSTIKEKMMSNYLTVDQKYNIIKYGIPTLISENDRQYYFLKYKYYLLNKNKSKIENLPIYINRYDGQKIFFKIFFWKCILIYYGLLFHLKKLFIYFDITAPYEEKIYRKNIWTWKIFKHVIWILSFYIILSLIDYVGRSPIFFEYYHHVQWWSDKYSNPFYFYNNDFFYKESGYDWKYYLLNEIKNINEREWYFKYPLDLNDKLYYHAYDVYFLKNNLIDIRVYGDLAFLAEYFCLMHQLFYRFIWWLLLYVSIWTLALYYIRLEVYLYNVRPFLLISAITPYIYYDIWIQYIYSWEALFLDHDYSEWTNSGWGVLHWLPQMSWAFLLIIIFAAHVEESILFLGTKTKYEGISPQESWSWNNIVWVHKGYTRYPWEWKAESPAFHPRHKNINIKGFRYSHNDYANDFYRPGILNLSEQLIEEKENEIHYGVEESIFEWIVAYENDHAKQKWELCWDETEVKKKTFIFFLFYWSDRDWTFDHLEEHVTPHEPDIGYIMLDTSSTDGYFNIYISNDVSVTFKDSNRRRIGFDENIKGGFFLNKNLKFDYVKLKNIFINKPNFFYKEYQHNLKFLHAGQSLKKLKLGLCSMLHRDYLIKNRTKWYKKTFQDWDTYINYDYVRKSYFNDRSYTYKSYNFESMDHEGNIIAAKEKIFDKKYRILSNFWYGTFDIWFWDKNSKTFNLSSNYKKPLVLSIILLLLFYNLLMNYLGYGYTHTHLYSIYYCLFFEPIFGLDFNNSLTDIYDPMSHNDKNFHFFDFVMLHGVGMGNNQISSNEILQSTFENKELLANNFKYDNDYKNSQSNTIFYQEKLWGKVLQPKLTYQDFVSIYLKWITESRMNTALFQAYSFFGFILIYFFDLLNDYIITPASILILNLFNLIGINLNIINIWWTNELKIFLTRNFLWMHYLYIYFSEGMSRTFTWWFINGEKTLIFSTMNLTDRLSNSFSNFEIIDWLITLWMICYNIFLGLILIILYWGPLFYFLMSKKNWIRFIGFMWLYVIFPKWLFWIQFFLLIYS